MHWEAVRPLATGCQNEYVQATEYGVRMSRNGRMFLNTRQLDPVSAMQEGVPVLFYVQGPPDGFEPRVVKADNRLSFLYIVSGATSAGGKEKTSPPIVLPFHRIGSVKDGPDALAICNQLLVKDEHLTADSAVLVEIGEHELQELPISDVLIFCAPPKLHLKERILACSANTTMSIGCGGSSKRQVVLHVDGVRLKDVKEIFENAEPMNLEVQFLTASGHPGGRAVSVQMKGQPHVGEVLQSVQRKAETLTAVDSARVAFVVREVLAAKLWARTFTTEAKGDLQTWFEQGCRVADPTPEDGEETKVRVPVGVKGQEELGLLRNKTHKDDPESAADQWGTLALTSVKLAMRHLLELENQRYGLQMEDEAAENLEQERASVAALSESRPSSARSSEASHSMPVQLQRKYLQQPLSTSLENAVRPPQVQIPGQPPQARRAHTTEPLLKEQQPRSSSMSPPLTGRAQEEHHRFMVEVDSIKAELDQAWASKARERQSSGPFGWFRKLHKEVECFGPLR